MKVYEVVEEQGVRHYLQKRGLIKAYRHKKAQFQEGRIQSIQLKKRQPKTTEVFQFRLTKKYRAFGYFLDEGTFLVTEISDHQ